jgi:biopolymer transport protein ExbB/TolQ
MSFTSLFETGGVVMYPLLFLSITNLSIVFYVFYELLVFRKKRIYETMLRKEMERKIFSLESVVSWLSNLSALSTLLGLLGTVIGIYNSFLSMQATKEASPEIFATGISQALITTIYGLSIAVPSVFFFHIYKFIIERIEFSIYLSEKQD